MTAEDKIHVALLLALSAVSGALFCAHEPATPPPRAAASVTGARMLPPAAEIGPAELDAAIAPLHEWVERRYRRAQTPRELGLGIAGLGRAALGADPEQALARVTRSWSLSLATTAPTAHVPGAPPRPDFGSPLANGEGAPMAVLGSLLEAGISLEQPLPLQTGSATLRELVSAALEKTARDKGQSNAESEAWELDLLALATLAGVPGSNERLGRLSYECLRRLELAYREWKAGQGKGELDASVVAKLASTFGEGREIEPGAAHLHASSALFRAVAVLGARDLEDRALRHLNALAFSYQVDRTIYDYLLEEARDSKERDRIHLAAIERLGRLEQALYQSHLVSRREDRPRPAPQLAKLMRQVGRDLLDHFRSVQGSAFSEAHESRTDAEREAALRAAVHALRGLRTARIAT